MTSSYRWILGTIIILSLVIKWIRVTLDKTAITPEELDSLLHQGKPLLLIDVRTPEEYHGPPGHIMCETNHSY